MITGYIFFDLAVKDNRAEKLNDSELGGLFVTAAAPDATDHDENEEPVAVGPKL